MRSDSYNFVAVVALLKPTIVGYLQMKIRAGPQATKLLYRVLLTLPHA